MPDSTETTITLSMTTRIHFAGEAHTNGVGDQDSHFIGSGSDFVMTFNVRDVADVDISELSIPDAIKSQNGKPYNNFPVLFLLHRSALQRFLQREPITPHLSIVTHKYMTTL